MFMTSLSNSQSRRAAGTLRAESVGGCLVLAARALSDGNTVGISKVITILLYCGGSYFLSSWVKQHTHGQQSEKLLCCQEATKMQLWVKHLFLRIRRATRLINSRDKSMHFRPGITSFQTGRPKTAIGQQICEEVTKNPHHLWGWSIQQHRKCSPWATSCPNSFQLHLQQDTRLLLKQGLICSHHSTLLQTNNLLESSTPGKTNPTGRSIKVSSQKMYLQYWIVLQSEI